MKDLLLTLLHLAVMTATLCGCGGVRAVIAENLLLKQQLIVVRRPRGVVARIVTGPHDAHRQDPHRPMRY